jgi:histidinol-phosphate aminotransferase
MPLNRRDLLGASALMLAGPAFSLRAGAKNSASGHGPAILCWNENPYGPSPAARRAIAAAIGEACRYPSEEEIDDLVAALARHEGTGGDHIATGSGSGELLCALGLICARDGGEIIAAEPTYLELTDYARAAGASVRFVPVDAHLCHDLNAMRAAVSDKTRAVYLCNPNNPTSTAVPAEQIRAFVAALPPHVLTIVDEAYMDFATEPGIGSVADLVRSGHNVVVLRTFSKLHGMAGMRMGYAVAAPATARALRQARMTYPNLLAVRAARASLDDQEFLSGTRRRILASRTRITTQLAQLKLRYAQPQTNFVFFDTGMPVAAFAQQMKARDILVGRPFPPFDSWCRVTIGTEPEVDSFLAALRSTTRA